MERPIVLIVDDDALVALMVETTFEDAGFEVRSARDAEAAATLIASPDLRLSALVTDINLGPGAKGWAVATEARIRRPLLPVVYMTGDSAADWAAFGVPKSVLVQKPFVGAQILSAVTALLNADSRDGA